MKNALSKTELRLKGEFPCRRLPATSCEISSDEVGLLFDVSSEPLPGSPPRSVAKAMAQPSQPLRRSRQRRRQNSEEKCDST
jgi:hypothetical protein